MCIWNLDKLFVIKTKMESIFNRASDRFHKNKFKKLDLWSRLITFTKKSLEI